jgi:lipopolysaccharide biosynthesis glycosyltransferase
MNVQYFTCGLGGHYALMAEHLKKSMPQVEVISEETVRSFGLNPRTAYWIKCFLWEIALPDTQIVVWLDCDIQVVGKLEYVSIAPFAAVLDLESTAAKERVALPEYGIIHHYFNSGFFSATRASVEMFQFCQSRVHGGRHGNCVEQGWVNYYLAFTKLQYEVLPRTYNYLVGSSWERPEGVIHDHYAGPAKMNWYETRVRRKREH